MKITTIHIRGHPDISGQLVCEWNALSVSIASDLLHLPQDFQRPGASVVFLSIPSKKISCVWAETGSLV